MLNISQLLQPVSEERRCGDDLTYSDDMDQIARARMEDDPALDQGEWVTTLRQADWPLVAGRCAVLIETRSKDMRLAVWLAEALARTQGHVDWVMAWPCWQVCASSSGWICIRLRTMAISMSA
jgi:type VI secretion system protein ImpA